LYQLKNYVKLVLTIKKAYVRKERRREGNPCATG